MTEHRTEPRRSAGVAPADLRIGLGPDFALGPGLHCAVSVHVPPVPRPKAVVFCYPGGGYDKSYYDLRFPGRTGYSMADELVAAGLVVVRCDHLGVGDSSHPDDPERIRPADLAAADSVVVCEVSARIAAGTLVDGLPALPGLPRFGVAHSMGGGLLTIQQSLFADFDGIATMGWSAVHMPTSTQMSERTGLPATSPGRVPPPGRPGYVRVARGPTQHHWYHWEDVPRDVIAADDRAAVEFPPCAGRMNEPGVVAEHAAAIDVPVLLLTGERDLRLPESDEPGAYPASPRVEFMVLPRSGHCHNMAGTRLIAWRGIAGWVDAVVAATASEGPG